MPKTTSPKTTRTSRTTKTKPSSDSLYAFDAEKRAAKMLVGEFRASKWGRLSLERPPRRAIQEDREEVTDDAPQDDWDDEQ